MKNICHRDPCKESSGLGVKELLFFSPVIVGWIESPDDTLGLGDKEFDGDSSGCCLTDIPLQTLGVMSTPPRTPSGRV